MAYAMTLPKRPGEEIPAAESNESLNESIYDNVIFQPTEVTTADDELSRWSNVHCMSSDRLVTSGLMITRASCNPVHLADRTLPRATRDPSLLDSYSSVQQPDDELTTDSIRLDVGAADDDVIRREKVFFPLRKPALPHQSEEKTMPAAKSNESLNESVYDNMIFPPVSLTKNPVTVCEPRALRRACRNPSEMEIHSGRERRASCNPLQMADVKRPKQKTKLSEDEFPRSPRKSLTDVESGLTPLQRMSIAVTERNRFGPPTASCNPPFMGSNSSVKRPADEEETIEAVHLGTDAAVDDAIYRGKVIVRPRKLKVLDPKKKTKRDAADSKRDNSSGPAYSTSDAKTSHLLVKAQSAPALMKAQIANVKSSETYPDADKLKILMRTYSMPIRSTTNIEPRKSITDDVDNLAETQKPKTREIQPRRLKDVISESIARLVGILEMPSVLFGIILYLMDISSDIDAATVYFRRGHHIWASLAFTFVVLPALSWAAVSWIWWYYDPKADEHPTYRENRMLLAILLLDPLVRSFRVLWFTCRREYCKCRQRRDRAVHKDDRDDPDYWQRLVNKEESTAAFLTAIVTLMEDAPEITLQLYIIAGYGIQQDIMGYIQLITSLGSICYTTAQFSKQVRLQKKEETRIETFSNATTTLFIWRTLIVGSRIMAFVLFALLFGHWLFVVVGFHYFLMFALVFYQMRLTQEKLVSRVLYNVVTPFIYIFDFCVNWLEGPTRYWYIMVYVPMYCENLLMSAMGLWHASNTPSPAWYIVPGFACVIVMFPVGLFVQAAYYLLWHPKMTVKVRSVSVEIQLEDWNVVHSRPTQLQYLMPWSDFKNIVIKANQRKS